MVLVILVSMEFVARLIGEARSRQRRRRLRLAWGIAAVLACALAVRAAEGTPDALDPSARLARVSPRAFAVLAPSAVFTQEPYMGVRCPIANSIACDRVGLAIWLRHPAVHVTASIAGQPLVLDWFGDERRVGPLPPRAELDGYLRPAHITTLLGVHPDSPGMWYGNRRAPWPAPLVRLWITFADGKRATTKLRVNLSAGWG
jgi:hypothetical protein